MSSITKFEKAVKKPIQQIEARDVQRWIETLISPAEGAGLSPKTVNRHLSEIRNYWRWMQSHQLVNEDHNPFSARRVRAPADRRKAKDEMRQRFRPDEIVALWDAAEKKGDFTLAAVVKIAAYSGARIEGVASLKVTDLRTDSDTKIPFMRMTDKTIAGDRCIPVHRKISELVKELSGKADKDGYLIPSEAKNKYEERGQPIGKRFGRLKSSLGLDNRYVFHSIRKTVAHLFETIECPEGVAKDIIGHAKTDLTYGLYSGETRIDHRAQWLEKAVQYPEPKHARHPRVEQTAKDYEAAFQSE